MTVTYNEQVATSYGLGCFLKLLFRWRGSIYKLIWPNLVVYIILYCSCSYLYRCHLNEESKRIFEQVSLHCDYFTDLIPVVFVLGFYVGIVVQRWWDQFQLLPWPDPLALYVSTSIHGQNESSRMMRRTIMRYVNVCQLITLRAISPEVLKRFPTLEHLVDAGQEKRFLTPNEYKILDSWDYQSPYCLYWIPLVWAGAIVGCARKESKIRDDVSVKTIIDEIDKFRIRCQGLLDYNWICIPLVYTQVVTLAVYSFFLGTIMGRQYLDPSQNYKKHDVDLYVPVFTLLQYFFYMGWLKVAESMVNPFGEDDDDFEVNWMVDRNLQVSYLIVDEMHSAHPELVQDLYWDQVFPQELPYTIASEPFRKDQPLCSTALLEVPDDLQEFLPSLHSNHEDELITDNKSNAIEITRSCRSSVNNQTTSTVSNWLNRVFHRRENVTKRNGRVCTPHHRGQMGRTASHISGTSRVTSQSSESSKQQMPSVGFPSTQDLGVFRMSDVSLCATHQCESTFNHFNVVEDDAGILMIRKGSSSRQDSHSDDWDENDSSTVSLLRPRQRSKNKRFFLGSGSGTGSTSVSSSLLSSSHLSEEDSRSPASTCTVRASIFRTESIPSSSLNSQPPITEPGVEVGEHDGHDGVALRFSFPETSDGNIPKKIETKVTVKEGERVMPRSILRIRTNYESKMAKSTTIDHEGPATSSPLENTSLQAFVSTPENLSPIVDISVTQFASSQVDAKK